MKGSGFDFIYWPIQDNKFCLNKYLCIENQVQEKETVKKVKHTF